MDIDLTRNYRGRITGHDRRHNPVVTLDNIPEAYVVINKYFRVPELNDYVEVQITGTSGHMLVSRLIQIFE